MKTEVRYFSKSGNTKKIADGIAKAVGTTARTIDEPITEKIDVLFIGTPINAWHIEEGVKTFLQEIDDSLVETVVAFNTAASPKNSALEGVKDALKDKNIDVYDECFHCRGKFLFMNKGRPTDDDVREAGEFAKGVLDKLSK